MRTTPGGHTLLELVVVLAIIGIALAAAAPHFAVTKRSATEETQAVIEAARRTALANARSTLMTIRTDGTWEIVPATSSLPTALGRLIHRGSPLALDISPVGICRPVLVAGRRMEQLVNPLTCQLSDIIR